MKRKEVSPSSSKKELILNEEIIKKIYIPDEVIKTILEFYAKKGFIELVNTMNISKTIQIYMLPFIINGLNDFCYDQTKTKLSIYDHNKRYAMTDDINKTITKLIQIHKTKIPSIFKLETKYHSNIVIHDVVNELFRLLSIIEFSRYKRNLIDYHGFMKLIDNKASNNINFHIGSTDINNMKIDNVYYYSTTLNKMIKVKDLKFLRIVKGMPTKAKSWKECRKAFIGSFKDFDDKKKYDTIITKGLPSPDRRSIIFNELEEIRVKKENNIYSGGGTTETVVEKEKRFKLSYKKVSGSDKLSNLVIMNDKNNNRKYSHIFSNSPNIIEISDNLFIFKNKYNKKKYYYQDDDENNYNKKISKENIELAYRIHLFNPINAIRVFNLFKKVNNDITFTMVYMTIDQLL